MSGVKDVLKNGWHPDKGTTLKQQVSGVFGRGDSSNRSTSHSATPLSQLKDPSSFAPPPKRSIAPPPPTSRSTASAAHAQPPAVPTRSGSGYYDRAAQSEYGNTASPVAEHEPAPQPRPFRVDTTGLSTANLPPPPLRRDAAGGSGVSPSPPLSAVSSVPPRLPPRLPPRHASGSSSPAASPTGISPAPPVSQSPSVLNQGAIGRLGAAGISVPGLGIGSGSRTSVPQEASSTSSPSQLSGLQARFAKLGTSSSPSTTSPTQPPSPPSEGTTFAQKQAALKTAANFHKDPKSVSFADARSAASTMNNFRQRHGDQVAAGLKTANGLNQKYGVTDKVATYSQQYRGTSVSQAPADSAPAPARQAEAPSGLRSLASAGTLAANALGKKRPPPPPPPKRKPDISRATSDTTVADDEPPPIPHATRPTF